MRVATDRGAACLVYWASAFMAYTRFLGMAGVAPALHALVALGCLALQVVPAAAQGRADLGAGSPFGSDRDLGFDGGGYEPPTDSEFLDPDSAEFDQWEPLVEEGSSVYDEPCETEPKEPLRPIDWMRHWGLRHSSVDGRHVDKSVPLTYTSWLNRPYHVGGFVGPLLSDDPVDGEVLQSNELLAGLRAGWDFDYYWGIECRLAWADTEVWSAGSADRLGGTYFAGDFDIVYYPWGDTMVRPYFLAGLGVSEIGSIDANGNGYEARLLAMPFGMGIEFPQTRWLAWRLEIVDNLAFGADGVDTMHNIAFTAGLDWRFGARPNSYWPWRSSRRIW